MPQFATLLFFFWLCAIQTVNGSRYIVYSWGPLDWLVSAVGVVGLTVICLIGIPHRSKYYDTVCNPRTVLNAYHIDTYRDILRLRGYDPLVIQKNDNQTLAEKVLRRDLKQNKMIWTFVGWKDTLILLRNEHPFLSIFYASPFHPLSRAKRAIIFMIGLIISFFLGILTYLWLNYITVISDDTILWIVNYVLGLIFGFYVAIIQIILTNLSICECVGTCHYQIRCCAHICGNFILSIVFIIILMIFVTVILFLIFIDMNETLTWIKFTWAFVAGLTLDWFVFELIRIGVVLKLHYYFVSKFESKLTKPINNKEIQIPLCNNVDFQDFMVNTISPSPNLECDYHAYAYPDQNDKKTCFCIRCMVVCLKKWIKCCCHPCRYTCENLCCCVYFSATLPLHGKDHFNQRKFGVSYFEYQMYNAHSSEIQQEMRRELPNLKQYVIKAKGNSNFYLLLNRDIEEKEEIDLTVQEGIQK